MLMTELRRTLTDCRGRQTPAFKSRLRVLRIQGPPIERIGTLARVLIGARRGDALDKHLLSLAAAARLASD
jgi:hypothetical protein